MMSCLRCWRRLRMSCAVTVTATTPRPHATSMPVLPCPRPRAAWTRWPRSWRTPCTRKIWKKGKPSAMGELRFGFIAKPTLAQSHSTSKNPFVTHSDKRVTKSLESSRDNWRKHHPWVILSSFFLFFFFPALYGIYFIIFLLLYSPF